MSEFEEREAAQWGGYTWPEWIAQTRRERIDALAHFRLHHLIETHSHDAIDEHMKREARLKGG